MDKSLFKKPKVLFFVAGAVLIVFLFLLRGLRSSSPEIQWAEVKRGDLVIDLVECGEIQAVNSMKVSAPMEWRADLQIVDMVPEGIMVEKGDFLVQLDTGFLQTELTTQQQQLESHLTEMQRINADQAYRLSQLRSDSVAAEFSMKQAQLQLELLKFESQARQEDARLALLKAQVALEEATTRIKAREKLNAIATKQVQLKIDNAQSRVKEIQRKMDELTLRAPIPGLVVYYERRGWWGREGKVKIGDKVNPGEAIIEIPDLSQMEAVLRLHEVDAEKIKVGQSAAVILEAFPERKFSGEVSDVAKLAQKEGQDSQIRYMEVKVVIAETDTILKPGMTAQAQILLQELEDVVYVPCGAVYEKEGTPVVFSSARYPQATPVKLGPRNDYWVVIEEALREGEKIAWQPPKSKAEIQNLGWLAMQQQRSEEETATAGHFQIMAERGLSYDYQANRGKMTLGAGSDSSRMPQGMEEMVKKLKGMAKGGQIGIQMKGQAKGDSSGKGVKRFK